MESSREEAGSRPGFLSRMMKGRGAVASEESEMPREERSAVERGSHTQHEHMHECEAGAEGEEGHTGLQQGNSHERPHRYVCTADLVVRISLTGMAFPRHTD